MANKLVKTISPATRAGQALATTNDIRNSELQGGAINNLNLPLCLHQVLYSFKFRQEHIHILPIPQNPKQIGAINLTLGTPSKNHFPKEWFFGIMKIIIDY